MFMEAGDAALQTGEGVGGVGSARCGCYLSGWSSRVPLYGMVTAGGRKKKCKRALSDLGAPRRSCRHRPVAECGIW